MIPRLITDATVRLSDFTIDRTTPPIDGPNFRTFLVTSQEDHQIYALKVVNVSPGGESAVPPAELVANVIRFFRPIATLLSVRHPALNLLRGWGVSLQPLQFGILVEYFPTSALATTADGGYALDPTSRQIVLYGIARALKYLHSQNVIHTDVQPSNILLDFYRRPHLTNVGEPSFSRTKEGIKGGCQRFIAPELFTRTGEAASPMDSYSVGILFYEFLVDGPAVPDEKAAHALRRGDRPPMTAATEEFKDVLGRLWHPNPRARMSMAELSAYFESDSRHWIPGTNPANLYRYMEFLNREEEALAGDCIPRAAVEKLFRDRSKVKVLQGIIDLPGALGTILGWLNSPNVDAVDETTRTLVVNSLSRQKLLDPDLLSGVRQAGLAQLPLVPSFFTTAVTDIGKVHLGKQLSAPGSSNAVSEGTIEGDPTVYAVKVFTLSSGPQSLGTSGSSFGRFWFSYFVFTRQSFGF
jgi:serine/threonine protein kinase